MYTCFAWNWIVQKEHIPILENFEVFFFVNNICIFLLLQIDTKKKNLKYSTHVLKLISFNQEV